MRKYLEYMFAAVTASNRRTIFFYDICWIAVLFLAAIFLVQANNCEPWNAAVWLMATLSPNCALWLKYKVFINCMWMGALGGVTISLKGVYDHGSASDPWKDDYDLWHLGRPISCAVAGLIAALLLFLVTGDKVSSVVLYGVAFVFGTQDRAFFEFISQFGAKFLPQRAETASVGPRIASVYPAHGGPGAIITIQGQGLKADWTVKIGKSPIDEPSVTPDGTTAVGKVPKIPISDVAAGASAVFDIVIVDKAGAGPTLAGKFTYEQPKAP
jgi:hypothetical protein